MDVEIARLEAVFGSDSRGASPSERAQSSKRLFVRSQHQLTFYDEGATGRQLSAVEALKRFGWSLLDELADRQAVPILGGESEPYRTLEQRLKELGLNLDKVCKRLGWPTNLIRDFEKRQQIPFRRLEQLAQALALDEDVLGVEPGARGDRALGVRLREIQGGDAARFSMSAVLGLAEAAWVVRKQLEMAKDVGKAIHIESLGFRPNDDYGSKYNPAWRIGYELAARSRDLLRIPAGTPIERLKELIEVRLGIPVIQMDLPPSFAGATVANGNNRGIVVNLKGLNENVWVRRMTLAHELGHLLWDPDHRLQRLTVDHYEDLDRYADVARALRTHRDFVEMRANGFAIEFLAPREAARKVYEKAGGGKPGIEQVMSIFGISKTAATYHLENAFQRTLDLSSFRLPSRRSDMGIDLEPSVDWIGREELAVDFFKPDDVPLSRRGRFAAFVADKVDAGQCSRDTAAALLQCKPVDIGTALEFARTVVAPVPDSRTLT